VGVIFGLALVCLGIAAILHNLRLICIEDALRFSPTVIIAWGLARLWNKSVLNVWGHTLIVVGGLLQIGFLDCWRGRAFEIYWPAIIIWIGLVISIKAFVPKSPKMEMLPTYNDESGWPGWEAQQRTGDTDTVEAVDVASEADVKDSVARPSLYVERYNEDGKDE
jgi:hypothetical protein